MFVPFSSLPSDARVWVFQSTRPFTAGEERAISDRLEAFTHEWSVHGHPLDTSFAIPHHQFIVLAADESKQAASGCSIDSSVRVLKEIESALKLSLFDREQVGFLVDGRVALFPMATLKQKFTEGMLNADTPTFNNLVTTKAAFEEQWVIRAADTWLRRFIPKSLQNV